MTADPKARPSPWSRIARLTASGALMLLIALALLEAGFQMASFFVEDRTSIWRPGATHRILCVGDSHTWGSAVDRDESYPEQLQAFLDDLEPGVHSVINHGLPGMNTSQVRERFAGWLQRYEPDVVVVWMGVNNFWNSAGSTDEVSLGRARLEGMLGRLRLYRLARVWLHDRQLQRYVAQERSERLWRYKKSKQIFGLQGRFVVHYDGVIEEIQHEGEEGFLEREGEERVERWVERDHRFVAGHARSAGVRLAFIAYPIPAGWFAAVNRAMRRAAERYQVPVVDTAAVVDHMPLEERDFLADGHPGPQIYSEIARNVAAAILNREQDLEKPGAR